MNLEAITIEDCIQLSMIGKYVVVENGAVVDIGKETK